jgi:cytochrome oxidase assembly protein ShyY1
VGVIRGFVPLGDQGEPAAVAAPAGEVTVRGWVARADRFDGTAPRDIEPVVEQPDTLPAVVLADRSDPAERGEQLQPVPLPDLGEGPHLSYAVQWFIFSVIAVVGYPLVLRRVVQRRGREVDDEDDEESPLLDSFAPPLSPELDAEAAARLSVR